MKKFTSLKINESNNSELEKGIKIESEHFDVYEYLDKYLDSYNVPMPCSKEEFYKKIAEAHLREIPDYYTRLEKMEGDTK